jgi:photosystem II stability/assembly factor-like uncharacterized protein
MNRSIGPLLVAGLACLSLVGACGYLPGSRPGDGMSSPPPQKPAPTLSVGPTPLPIGSNLVWDADLVDGSMGWMLAAQGCGQSGDPCQYAVIRTNDGGKTWSEPVAIGTVFASSDGDAPRFVRFVNRTDGFVYGHTAAFATHDGGRTWSDAGIPPFDVVAIAGRGNTAWALSRDCAKGVTCPYTVRSSVDGGRTWVSHQLPSALFSPADAIPFGSGGLLVSSATDMALTVDGGMTWRLVGSHCAGNETFRSVVATSDGKEIWQLCTGLANGVPSDKALFVSEDGGATWSASSTGGLPVSGGLVDLVAAPGATAFITSEVDPIFETNDAGRSWTKVAPPTAEYPKGWGFLTLRFAAAGDAWALDLERHLWASHDGGSSWSPLPKTGA